MTQLSLFLIFYKNPMILSCLYLSWEKLTKITVAILKKIKMLAPVRISFFTSIFSFKMLTSSAWPITLNPPNTLHKVTGVLMCDYKEIMRVIRPVIYLFICLAKRQQTLQLWQTYNGGLGLQFAKGKKKGLIKTHSAPTPNHRGERVWDKMNFPVLFIFHWILFFQRIELGFWLLVKICKKRKKNILVN